jgi:hypothetical protein
MANVGAVVGLVVDSEWGERVRELAARMPVWVVDTPANRAAVTALREEASDRYASVTTFRSTAAETPEQACIRILPTLDTHHNELAQTPPYSAVEIVGAQPTDILREAFEAFQLTVFDMSEHGFVVRRASRQTE